MKGFKNFVLIFILASFSELGYCLEQSEYFKAKRYRFPVVEHSIIFSSTGFYPNKLILKEGVKLRLFFTSNDDNGCFFLPDKNIFLSAKSHSISEKEIYFEKAGHYKFSCPSNKGSGEIIVLGKKKNIKRNIASIKKINVWMPRDY